MVCPTISEWQGRKTTLSPCKHEKQNQRKSGETRRPSVFHEIPRAAGPVQQTTKNDGLPHQEIYQNNSEPIAAKPRCATFEHALFLSHAGRDTVFTVALIRRNVRPAAWLARIRR